MAYGFVLNMGGGNVYLEKTYHGVGSGQNVVEINGQNVVGMSKDGVQKILDTLRQTQGEINFLLSDGGNLSFQSDSAQSDWSTQRATEQV